MSTDLRAQIEQRIADKVAQIPRTMPGGLARSALRHRIEELEWCLAILSTAEKPQICPSHICAICYHEKDTCSHCDVPPAREE